MPAPLFPSWSEVQDDTGGPHQVRVAVYNGDGSAPAWTFVDGNSTKNGINKNPNEEAESIVDLEVSNSKLYATWQEASADSGTDQVRVAVYSGDDSAPAWTFVDGDGTNGINKDSTKIASGPMLIDFNSKLYATWSERKTGTGNEQIRVAVGN